MFLGQFYKLDIIPFSLKTFSAHLCSSNSYSSFKNWLKLIFLHFALSSPILLSFE